MVIERCMVMSHDGACSKLENKNPYLQCQSYASGLQCDLYVRSDFATSLNDCLCNHLALEYRASTRFTKLTRIMCCARH